MRNNHRNTTLIVPQGTLPSTSNYTITPINTRTFDFFGLGTQQHESPSTLLGREIERAIQLGDVDSPGERWEQRGVLNFTPSEAPRGSTVLAGRLTSSPTTTSTQITECIQIDFPASFQLGSRNRAFNRSDIVYLLSSALCYRIVQVRKTLAGIGKRPTVWPRQRQYLHNHELRLWKNDLRVIPGGRVPLHPRFALDIGHDQLSSYGHLDILLALREERAIYFVTAWQRCGEGWIERGAALFDKNTFVQLDIEVGTNFWCRSAIKAEKPSLWN